MTQHTQNQQVIVESLELINNAVECQESTRKDCAVFASYYFLLDYLKNLNANFNLTTPFK
jgi:hypothetical protein